MSSLRTLQQGPFDGYPITDEDAEYPLQTLEMPGDPSRVAHYLLNEQGQFVFYRVGPNFSTDFFTDYLDYLMEQLPDAITDVDVARRNLAQAEDVARLRLAQAETDLQSLRSKIKAAEAAHRDGTR